MAKHAHGFPVGMMAVNGIVGQSNPTLLRAALKRIYEGEPSIGYEACNHVQSYGDGDMWDEGDPEPSGSCQRITNNIDRWIVFLQQIQDVCNEFGAPPGTIKAMISRNLSTLVLGHVSSGGNVWLSSSSRLWR